MPPAKAKTAEYTAPPTVRFDGENQPFACSATLDRLLPALQAARQEMGKLIKDKTNPHFNSGYASLEAVFETYKPAFCSHGLSIIHTLGPEDTMTGTLFHVETGQWISSTLTLQMGRGGPQEQASATTYARRYIDCALVGLAPEDDDGNRAQTGHKTTEAVRTAPVDPQPPSEPAVAPASEKEMELVKTFIAILAKVNTPEDFAEACKDIGEAKIDMLTTASSIKRLQKKADNARKRIDDGSLPGQGCEEVVL